MWRGMFSNFFESGGQIICEGKPVDKETAETLYSSLTSKKLYIESYGMSSKEAMLKYNGKIEDYRTDEGIIKKREFK